MDADDVSHPGRLSVQLDVMESDDRPGLVSSDFSTIHEGRPLESDHQEIKRFSETYDLRWPRHLRTIYLCEHGSEG